MGVAEARVDDFYIADQAVAFVEGRAQLQMRLELERARIALGRVGHVGVLIAHVCFSADRGRHPVRLCLSGVIRPLALQSSARDRPHDRPRNLRSSRVRSLRT